MSAQMIIIEGLIGVGKTTLAHGLAKELNLRVMEEPVDDNPYLSKFYEDPKRFALEMQFWLMSRRFAMHQEAIEHIWRTGQGVIMDRSIYGDEIFAKKNYLDGNIEDMGYQNYQHMRNVMCRFLMVPHVTLFLSASPEVCIDRIKSRNRSCEAGVPTAYLSGLQSLYDELLNELKDLGSNVVNLDWASFKDARAVIEEFKERGLSLSSFHDYASIDPQAQSHLKQPVSATLHS